MGKILIISEKPNVTKKVKDALAPNAKYSEEGYYENDDFVLSNCLGHLLTQRMPGEIDPVFASWKLENLPFKFEKIPLNVKEDTKSQYKTLVKLLRRTDIDEVVNCCDPDREGELIFRSVYYSSSPYCKKNSRMWTESIASSNAIKEAFDERKDGMLYGDLYLASVARRDADYHFGLNGTMAMTTKFGQHKTLLSLGRVQTPTLNMIVQVDLEIENFKPKTFYKLEALTSNKIVGDYYNPDLDQNRFMSKDDADAMVKKVGLGESVVTLFKETTRRKKQDRLYNLSDLQVEMNKKYKLSAQNVLDICQSLYEKHGLITYPRTNENRISQELYTKTKTILTYLPSMFKDRVKTIFDNDYSFNMSSVAKKDIGSHEALTPVVEKISDSQIGALSDREYKVYTAIVERFLVQFYPEAVYKKQEIEFVRNGETFKSNIENCVDAGFLACYSDYKPEKDKKEFDVKEGDKLTITELNVKTGETEPPKHFTEGSLIALMQSPLKYVSSKEDKDILKQTQGLGTEATRAAIIEELKRKKYIEDVKGKIISTTLGRQLIASIPSEIPKSVPLTVMFEKKLANIEKGTYKKADFMNDIFNIVENLVNDIKQSEDNVVDDENKLIDCPQCHKGSIIQSKYGWYCNNRECKCKLNYDSYTRFGYKKVNATQAKELLISGKTKKKVKCHSATKNTDYEAYLTYAFKKDEQYPNNCFVEFPKNNFSKNTSKTKKS